LPVSGGYFKLKTMSEARFTEKSQAEVKSIRSIFARMIWVTILIITAGDAFGQSRYNLELHLDPDAHTLKGTEQVVFHNRGDSGLSTLTFFLPPNILRDVRSKAYQKSENLLDEPDWMNIARVAIAGQAVVFTGSSTSQMTINLPGILASGDSVTLTIDFTTYFPSGRHYLVPSRTGTIYRLIAFYPILQSPSIRPKGSPALESVHLENALYQMTCVTPSRFRLAGSLANDTTLTLDAERIKFVFKPDSCREIAFIALAGARVSSTKNPTGDVMRLISRRSISDPVSDNLIVRITKDIQRFYAQQYFPAPLNHLTVFSTVIPGGYTAPGFIMLEKQIYQGVTRLEYISLHILAREIARQYLMFDKDYAQPEAISISNGFASLAANKYLTARYAVLRSTFKVRENKLVTFSNRLLALFLSSFEKENILQQASSSSERANYSYIREQTRYVKSQKILETTAYILGDQAFRKILSEYRRYCLAHRPQPAEFFRLATAVSGYDFLSYYTRTNAGVETLDSRITRVHKRETDESGPHHYRTDVYLAQRPKTDLPIEVLARDRQGQLYFALARFTHSRTDTVTFITAAPVTKISLDPNRILRDTNRLNNYHPRLLSFNFLTSVPRLDSYQIFYYPTFDFNRQDYTRVGFKLRSRYWINLQPLLPAKSMDEWSFGMNYGYKSQTYGYDVSYSTSILAILLKPRIQLRVRDYFDLFENQMATEFYLGELHYLGLERLSGYQRLRLGTTYQNVRSLAYLNNANWETGRLFKAYFDFTNFHNWGEWRHAFLVKGSHALPAFDSQYEFTKLSVDGQVKARITEQSLFYQRLFVGVSNGHLPKQEYFYFFGKNVFENLAFESYRLAKGEGDMRGYGGRALKGRAILTSNTELRRSLASKEPATFDCLIFYDAGWLPSTLEQINLTRLKRDAGIGLEFNVIEEIMLGIHFPLWVSHPPRGEAEFALRWVIAFDLTL